MLYADIMFWVAVVIGVVATARSQSPGYGLAVFVTTLVLALLLPVLAVFGAIAAVARGPRRRGW